MSKFVKIEIHALVVMCHFFSIPMICHGYVCLSKVIWAWHYYCHGWVCLSKVLWAWHYYCYFCEIRKYPLSPMLQHVSLYYYDTSPKS
jgi:hypothetical protein